jgi:hypothetical protein
MRPGAGQRDGHSDFDWLIKMCSAETDTAHHGDRRSASRAIAGDLSGTASGYSLPEKQ